MKILKYLLFPLALYALGVSAASFTIWGLAPFNPANWHDFLRFMFSVVTLSAWVTFGAVDLEI